MLGLEPKVQTSLAPKVFWLGSWEAIPPEHDVLRPDKKNINLVIQPAELNSSGK